MPAHLGDAIILTAIIRTLKEAIPNLEIDILCGSWSKVVFETHPAVSRVYCVDLVQLNRRHLSKSEKNHQYDKTRSITKDVLGGKKYDLAAVAYAYEPSYIPTLTALLRDTPIVGFTSAGYGPLLSKAFGPGVREWHGVQHYASLFEQWLGKVGCLESYTPWLALFSDALWPVGLPPQDYVVIHPGTAGAAKEWLEGNWTDLIDGLVSDGRIVVLTGQGDKEAEIAKRISKDRNVINLVNKLTFQQFCHVISKAVLLVGVDSVAGHLAAAYGRRGVVIAAGTANIGQFRPLSQRIRVLSRPMPCSPCNTRPCAERPCITGISASDVRIEIKKVLI